jgi:outer membrane protein TolC
MAVARDGIVKDLVEAYTNLRASDAAVVTTQRQLDSALGGYRVAHSLYIGGRTNSTALLDAETALSQARFAHLDARADARIARVLLDHQLGRDARMLDH